MNITAIVSGVSFAGKRAVDRFIIQPGRIKSWKSKTSPFVYRNDMGNVFELHPDEYVDRNIYRYGVYERRFLELLIGRFPPGAVALDIGANIGNHAISLARSFALIHAFEPNPSVLVRMRRNISLNGITNIETHGVGLGKADAQLPFKENLDGNLGASGFLKPGQVVDDKSRMLHLEIVHADRVVDELKLDRLDFVKIDVEGWEADVFEGLNATIARFRPIIAFEFHGGSAPDGDFQRMVANLPGYIIAEARYAPADASLFNKIAWNTVYKGKPTFRIFHTPEARTYENIFAFPDDASFRRFAEG